MENTQLVKRDLKQMKFTSDLIRGSLNQLDFLKELNAFRIILNREDLLKKACYRYEKLWLPFYIKESCNNTSNLIPPLDIEFIWHCHLLCPTEYYRDCNKLFGKLVLHSNLDPTIRHRARKQTKLAWEKAYPNVSFDYSDLDSVNQSEYATFKSNIEYNLIAAADRQFQFYYQVSLPHYNDKKYLKIALKRYKKFIYLFKLYPNEFLVPCYSIDLIWHTHQRDPVSYTNDTKQILGKILNHDDSVNDRSTGSVLNRSFEKTCELWKKTFGENYFNPGGMWRGNRTEFDLNSDSVDFQVKSVNIYEIVLNNKTDNQISVEINNTDNFNLFSVKMNYFGKIKSWSDIKLIQEDKLISFSRLINLNELPSREILPNIHTNLDLKNERAMILSNQSGDYAIVKGKCKPSSINDSFTISYYSLIDDLVKLKLNIKPNQKNIQFKFDHFQVKIDLKLAIVRIEVDNDCLIKDNKLIMSNLFTFLFSFICLYLPLVEEIRTDYLMFNMFSSNLKGVQFQTLEKCKPKNFKTTCGCF